MAHFLGQNQVVMAGQFQGREPPWKPFYAPYHLLIHGTAWLWTIFDHPSHTSMPGGGQKSLIFREKSDNCGRPVPGRGTSLETISCALLTPLGPFCPLKTPIHTRLSVITRKMFPIASFWFVLFRQKKKENLSASRKVIPGTCCVIL